MKNGFVFVLLHLLLWLFPVASQAQNEYNVLPKWHQFRAEPNALYEHLTSQAYKYLAERAEEIKKLRTLADWRQRQKMAQKKLAEAVGAFPAKTPLNPKITGTITKTGYRIEHVVFESRPGFYVTSSLYVPEGQGKRPAILYCSGHGATGYRSEVYQRMILNLVKKGFVVLAFDPVGQGERLNYLDPQTGESTVGAPTREHYYPGIQAFITGSSLANYMIWDGIRAVDYLLTRPEVDATRLGITGRSGGGTQSAYIAAFDDRILAAAPEAYLTNFTRLLQSIGPQDAEQDFLNQISIGLDHADFLEVRAPRPALMITTTNDMFSIQGARETEAEVARLYAAYGKPENFGRAEDFGVHESTKKNREAMYSFFQKHLGQPGSPSDEDVDHLTKEELQVTPSGQLATSLGGETIFSLTEKEAEVLAEAQQVSRKNLSSYLPRAVAAAQKLSGYREPSMTDEPVMTGNLMKKGFSIEKYFLKGEGDYVIPYLLYLPAQPDKKALLYLHPGGKAQATASGDVEEYVRRGYTVLVPDMVGNGELGPGDWSGENYFKHARYAGLSYPIWTAGLLVGRSIAGIRAGDAVKLAHVLKKRTDAAGVSATAVGEMAPVLLHAAAFDKSISEITLREPLTSYRSLVTTRFYQPGFTENAVPAVLQAYDLPDLAASLAPRKLTIFNPLDGSGEAADKIDLEKDFSVIKAAYESKKAEKNLRIETKN